jgi:hypothetical protein
MRYRSDLPDPTPATVDDTMVLGTALYALFLGIGLCFGGWLGHKPWIVSIGVTLFLSGAAYLMARLTGWW